MKSRKTIPLRVLPILLLALSPGTLMAQEEPAPMAQEEPAPEKMAQEEMAQVDAERADSAALTAKGRVSYNLYCRSCHGEWGKGDGSVAEVLTVRPADLTGISARNQGEFSFDQVYKVIDGRQGVRGHGGDMPVWGTAFKNTEETEDELVVKEKIIELVYYLKSIQVQPAAGSSE